MKYDLTELNTTRISNELRRGAVRRMVERRSAGAELRRKVGSPMRPKHGPGARPPLEFDENTVPEFNVTVLVTRQPRDRYTAELVWTVGNASGRFPIVERNAGPNSPVRKSETPFEFKREDAARKAAVKECEDLVSQFIDWALQ